MSSTGVAERMLWSGTRRPRVCSALRRPRIAVTEWMRQAVDEVYRQWLGLPTEWTPQQRERFIDQLTSRLDQQAAEMAVDLQAGEVARWTREHQGQHPDHSTSVALYRTSEENAREAVVRSELYDKIPRGDEDSEYQSPPPISGVPWDKRWADPRFQVEPSEQVQELANRVWPDRSPMFQMMAAHLLAVRLQDGMELPTSHRHVLAVKLVTEVNEELAKIGRPAE